MYCDLHGEYEATQLHFGRFSKCPKCAEDRKRKVEAEKERALAVEKTRFLSELKKKSGIPFRYSGIKLRDFVQSEKTKKVYATAERYINRFPDLKQFGCSLVMCGKPGTGKTHLACTIGNELLKAGESVRYTTAYKAIVAVKATYVKNPEKTEADILKEFQDPDLLIIDEVGVQFGSETEKLIFYQIINNRYENILPTILISNLDKAEVVEFIGERTVDRLKEGNGAVLVFDWGSFRPGNKRPVATSSRLSAWERFQTQ